MRIFWDHDGARLTNSSLENPTIYEFGYQARAEELCFSEREWAQIRNMVDGVDIPVPPCA